MSDNWVVQNLENALETWNEKLSEIWQLITQSPEQFKGGTIWNGLRFALTILSGNILYSFAFVAACGPLQTHFHSLGFVFLLHLS